MCTHDSLLRVVEVKVEPGGRPFLVFPPDIFKLQILRDDVMNDVMNDVIHDVMNDVMNDVMTDESLLIVCERSPRAAPRYGEDTKEKISNYFT